MFKTILLCSDGSEHSLRAIHVGADLARKYDAELILLTTAETSGMTGQTYTGLQLSNQIDSVLEAQGEIETRSAALLASLDVEFRTRREQGHPVDRITSVAVDEEADLIVIGARGLSTFSALLVGSVSAGVVQHAPCPVLIVK
ncbi:MAG: universal stress protein [Armatimonadota bacterium]